MNALYYIAIVLISGILMAKIVSELKLPYITGYLLGGIIIGPSFLNIIPKEMATQMLILSELALGFIAYSIGSEFNVDYIKKLGQSIFIITICEVLGAVLLVFITMFFIFRQPFTFSLLIAAIASTTAPAATIMVIRQYKAKGSLVNTLLPVVALDDAIGIMAFGIIMAIAKQFSSESKHFSLMTGLFVPILELGGALLIGGLIGFLLVWLSRKAKGKDQLLIMVIAAICLSIGIADFLDLSTLLSCMALGAIVSNIAPNNMKVISVTETFTPPIYVIFFTLAGIELNLASLQFVGLIGIGYVLARVLGKVLGAYVGSTLSKMPSEVRNYLGLTLIPQAGVAIGLSMTTQMAFPHIGQDIRTIILGATLIYELLGPLITKLALIQSGDIPNKTGMNLSKNSKKYNEIKFD